MPLSLTRHFFLLHTERSTLPLSTMKLENILIPAVLFAFTDGFSATQTRRQPVASSLNAVDRRAMIATTASVGSVLLIPTVSLAADDYVPQLKDMQQIYCESAKGIHKPTSEVLFVDGHVSSR
jgi:hypothetical protein